LPSSILSCKPLPAHFGHGLTIIIIFVEAFLCFCTNLKSIRELERLNGEIRQREKIVRGIKKSDSVLLQGYQLYHNYFREHQGLVGKTPAEVAGIRIEGKNKWITVIQNASKLQN